ncbi:trichohyalin-like [Orbicella faveolata]|uniref:trichohyalin-like n=1 Tax=Orbicella faveolata TaxID=48498 RepID=UPI0009E62708|nr:trichohyalin-like [Orbicella faveolata]
MSESGEASGPPIQQESDSESDEDNDTDFDPEEIEKEIMGVRSLLRRHCGHHKLVNKAEEVERARRMSIPFSADVEETELDINVQSGQLSNVHQELLHLFAIHDVSYNVKYIFQTTTGYRESEIIVRLFFFFYSIHVFKIRLRYVTFQAKFQMDCERERRTVETTKNQMHEELLRNMARQKARQEFELERERKIKEMRKLTETISEEGIAMAETNDKLNHVHADLKNAFKMMRDAKAAKEESQREKTEDLKEMMLQEIRRRPRKNEKELIEQERNRRAELYQQQMNERRGSTDVLLEVQEQLLKIFSKLKREKKIKKIEIKQHQEDNKVRMQEELVRKSFQKEVSIQEAHEKARRIMESKSDIADGDEEKTKAIDMLIDVQKQLLDVFAISKVRIGFPRPDLHEMFKRLFLTGKFLKLLNRALNLQVCLFSQVQDVKQRMNHLKLMNCRKNMLRQIRSRRVDRENTSGFT